MIYGYIRVSTDKQTTENQKFEIENYCRKNGIKIDKWIGEKISGKIDFEQRCLGKILRKTVKGDVIICSELSRLSRTMYALITILYQCEKRNVDIVSIKENFNTQESKYAKLIAPIFAIFSEFERNLISQRTKDALACKKAAGIKLGRPVGRKSTRKKLTGKEALILKMKNEGFSKQKMAEKLKINIKTLATFIKDNNL
jgi:DNA invertase Pin-like site-specific DNA recombinase